MWAWRVVGKDNCESERHVRQQRGILPHTGDGQRERSFVVGDRAIDYATWAGGNALLLCATS